MTRLRIILLCVIGTVGYIAWGVMAWLDPAQRTGFLSLNISMVTGTIGLALRDLPNALDSSAQPQRKGEP